MEKRRQPEVVAGRVNSDGSIAAGDGFTVNKIGTASYVITFPASFRVFAATASTSGANGYASALFGFDPNGIRCATVPIATPSTPADMAFSFVAVGIQQ